MADTTKKTIVATLFSDIKTIVNEVEPDVEKFTIQGNAAAGTRLRKAMQQIKELGQDVRTAVQDAKNAGK